MKINLIWLAFVAILAFASCKNDDVDTTPPLLQLKLGGAFVSDSAVLAINDTISFGIHAEGISSNLTYVKVDVVNSAGTSTIYDEGINTAVLDVNKTFFKGLEANDRYVVTVMDYNRNTTTASFTVLLDSLSTFGPIYHFSNLVIGYQSNTSDGHFIDASTGTIYTDASVAGHESEIDILAYYYLSSGSPSPSLVCPAQGDAQLQYPAIVGWTVKNATLYDYHTSDYGLVSEAQFDACNNDSLLLVSYDPTYVNQKCKFATAGKIIPFLTADGKKGLIKVIAADFVETGTMTIEIKIQQ